MTSLERDIQNFILQMMLAADGSPLTDESVRKNIRNGFNHVAFTAQEITSHISAVESKNLIVSTQDEIFGMLWGLTPKGKLAAEQLR